MVARPANAAPAEFEPSELKLGTILRDVLPELGGAPWLDSHKRTVLYRLAQCGTNAAGMFKLECQDCDHSEWRPLSCQDRHCPSCGSGRAEDWIQARLGELLDVDYSHITVNLPKQLHALCKDNPRELYSLFFKAVQLTLKAIAADCEHLGGTPAFFCVLHTATSRLYYWPHIHVLIAHATFDEDTGKLSIAPEGQPLFDAQALADAIRDRFLEALRACAKAGKLDFTWQGTQAIQDPEDFEDFLEQLADQPWKVWLEPTTAGVETTIRYLGRYVTHTAITNARIIHYDGASVTYTYKDNDGRHNLARTVPRRDFVRIFADHILPKGFQRVRFFGLLAPTKRKSALTRAQAAARETTKLRRFTHAVQLALRPETLPALRCTKCGSKNLRTVAVLRGRTLIILQPRRILRAFTFLPVLPIPPPSPAGLTGRKAP